ncbi:MAG TPA: hypothetical protein VGG10_18895 [Rhizomicrobium sp.]|jgi:hypothetical protein
MNILPVSPDAPFLVKAGADALLVLHIGGGCFGLVSGATALITRKGGWLHKVSGDVFFVSMLFMSGIGAVVAPLLNDIPSSIAGVLTFYLVVTSWAAVRRRDGGAGLFETGGFAVALAVAAAGALFIVQARNSPTGTIAGNPPEAFYVFLFVGAIAAISDLRVILRRGVSGGQRIARHLWRMCVALTIGAVSASVQAQNFMPAALRHTPLVYVLLLLSLTPLVVMAFWLFRVRRRNRTADAVAAREVRAAEPA